jgi:hypothetical protein
MDEIVKKLAIMGLPGAIIVILKVASEGNTPAWSFDGCGGYSSVIWN